MKIIFYNILFAGGCLKNSVKEFYWEGARIPVPYS